MKIFLITFLGLLCLSSARVGLSDGPFWCLDTERGVKSDKLDDNPVLVVNPDGSLQEYHNEFDACSDYSVSSYYRLRKTPKNIKKCNPAGVPVCGLTQYGTLVDYRDECAAAEDKVPQYFRGQCPRSIDEDVHYCSSLPRPLLAVRCFAYIPACAKLVTGGTRTVNSCGACIANDVISWVYGECEGDAKAEPVIEEPIVKPLPVIEEPIIVKPLPVIREPIIKPLPVIEEPVEPIPVIDPLPIKVLPEPQIAVLSVSKEPQILIAEEPEPEIAICYMAPPEAVEALPEEANVEDPIMTIQPVKSISLETIQPIRGIKASLPLDDTPISLTPEIAKMSNPKTQSVLLSLNKNNKNLRRH